MGIKSPIVVSRIADKGVTTGQQLAADLQRREVLVSQREADVQVREDTLTARIREFDAEMQRRIEAVTQRELAVAAKEIEVGITPASKTEPEGEQK